MVEKKQSSGWKVDKRERGALRGRRTQSRKYLQQRFSTCGLQHEEDLRNGSKCKFWDPIVDLNWKLGLEPRNLVSQALQVI